MVYINVCVLGFTLNLSFQSLSHSKLIIWSLQLQCHHTDMRVILIFSPKLTGGKRTWIFLKMSKVFTTIDNVNISCMTVLSTIMMFLFLQNICNPQVRLAQINLSNHCDPQHHLLCCDQTQAWMLPAQSSSLPLYQARLIGWMKSRSRNFRSSPQKTAAATTTSGDIITKPRMMRAEQLLSSR